MVKRVKATLFGRGGGRKAVTIDADATDGAVIGTNLRWADGSLVSETEIRNSAGGGTVVTTPGGSVNVSATLWSLILNIPTIIKNIAVMTSTGLMRHVGAGVVTADNWPYVKNRIDTGESLTIPLNHQLLVYENFWFEGGQVVIEGDLVIL